MQSGLSASRPGSRAISTAIGYNQLLTTNSVELLAEQGHEFVKALTAEGRDAVRRAAQGDGSQARGAEADGGVHAHGAGRLVGARKARQHAAGLGGPRHGAGHRRRADAADPQAPDLGDLRARQGLQQPAHRRRTRDDEPDRRRHRARHGDDAAGDARAGADLEFLPARRLRAQSRSRSATTRWRSCWRSPTSGWISTATSPARRNWRRRFRRLDPSSRAKAGHP